MRISILEVNPWFFVHSFTVNNQRQGHIPFTIEIPKLSESRLGPNKAVLEYLEVTKHFRKTGYTVSAKNVNAG